MKAKKLISLLLVIAFGAALLTGCGLKKAEPEAPPVVEQPPEPTAEPEPTPAVEVPEEPPMEFADVAGLEFWFGSGVGAWSTTLQIQPDGSFTGCYHDSEMGITGENYPNGTMYLCNFYGTLTERTQVDDHSFTAQVNGLGYEKSVGTEEIIDDVRYVYSDIYGFGSNALLTFYSADTPIEDLPEAFLDWVRMDITDTTGKLGFIGLYNSEAETGFSSYEAMKPAVEIALPEAVEDAPASSSAAPEAEPAAPVLSAMEAELAEIAKKADAIDQRLKTESLSQAQMNELAEEQYKLWDTELNSIWRRLKSKLSEAEMAKVTQEEIRWIGEKEAAMQSASADYQGGSMYSMIYYSKGAELTQARVYVLAEYLK